MRGIFNDLGNGTAVYTGKAQAPNGAVISTSPRLKAGYIATHAEILSKNGIINYNNQQKATTMHKWNKNVTSAETIQGRQQAVRREVTENQNFTLKPLNIELINTSGSQQTIVLFDGLNDIAVDRGIPAPPAGFVIGGSTFGARTLSRLNQAALGEPMRLHTMQGQSFNATTGAADDSYFSTNRVEVAESNEIGVVTSNPIDFALTQDGSQFNQNIRLVRGFRFIGSARTGIIITVPDNTKLSFTFKVQSTAAGALMKLA